MQISLDGATPTSNDVAVRGAWVLRGRAACHGGNQWPPPDSLGCIISVVITRRNVGQRLRSSEAICRPVRRAARITGLRRSGQAWKTSSDELHLHRRPAKQRELYDWLVAHGTDVLTGDSFFHLSGYGAALPGLGMCGAGRVVCLIDPVGDVHCACPFAIHPSFLAGSVRDPGGFAGVWQHSELFSDLRRPQTGGACESCSAFGSCRGGSMAVAAGILHRAAARRPGPRSASGGHGEQALAAAAAAPAPRPSPDHSHRTAPHRTGERRPVPLTLLARPPVTGRPPVSACDANPLAGFLPGR